MSPSKNDSATTASYILILGSLLTIIPNIPVINEILPIISFDTIFSKGGTNFLGSYLTIGNYQGNFQTVKGWTMLGLPGDLLFLIFVGIGVAGLIVGLVLKTRSLVKLVGLIGGLIDVLLIALVFIGNSQDFNKYGLSDVLNSNFATVGLGFWIILIGSILILASGLLLVKD